MQLRAEEQLIRLQPRPLLEVVLPTREQPRVDEAIRGV